MIWNEFHQSNEQFSNLFKLKFNEKGLILLGTIRKNGIPRISPVEIFFVQNQILLGLMNKSKKYLDILRDPRGVVQNIIMNNDGSDGEFKFNVEMIELPDPLIRNSFFDEFARRWNNDIPKAYKESAHIFTIDIKFASITTWNIKDGKMFVKMWHEKKGFIELSKNYP